MYDAKVLRRHFEAWTLRPPTDEVSMCPASVLPERSSDAAISFELIVGL